MKNREKQANKIANTNIDDLLKVTKAFQDEVQSLVVKAVSGELDEKKKKAVISEIQKVAQVADEETKAWLTKTVPEIYISGMKATDTVLKKYGIKVGKERITIELLKNTQELTPHLEAVNSLLSDAYMDFGYGINGLVKGARHVLNDTLKRQVQAKIALGRLDGASIREIRKEIENVLKDRKFTVLIDRGGRQWKLENYSQMLARTHMIRVNTEASVNRAIQFGVDIMEVSDHNTDTPVCQQYEGNIYSLSGKSKNYQKLPASPPFHPNCKHTLIPRPDLN